MTILYFTATGNSLAVAKRLGGTLLSIPQLIREELYVIEDDIIGIISPTYCADLPHMVREYLDKAKLQADESRLCHEEKMIADTAHHNLS